MQAEYATADAEADDPAARGVDDADPSLATLGPAELPVQAATSKAIVASRAASTQAGSLFGSRFVLMPVSLRFGPAWHIPQWG
jgi:hypothetical protein